jgi:hypothetical protein
MTSHRHQKTSEPQFRPIMPLTLLFRLLLDVFKGFQTLHSEDTNYSVLSETLKNSCFLRGLLLKAQVIQNKL